MSSNAPPPTTPPPPDLEAPDTSDGPFGSTIALRHGDDGTPMPMRSPFRLAEPGAPVGARVARGDIPGAPWAAAMAPAVPQPMRHLTQTLPASHLAEMVGSGPRDEDEITVERRRFPRSAVTPEVLAALDPSPPESVTKIEPVVTAEPVKAPEPAKKAEPVVAPEPMKVPEPVTKAEPAKKVEPIVTAEPAKTPEPAKKAEPATVAGALPNKGWSWADVAEAPKPESAPQGKPAPLPKIEVQRSIYGRFVPGKKP